MRETDAIRYGLLALHWGWVMIILNPADPLKHYAGYRNFLLIASVHHWVVASIGMAIVALCGFIRWFWLQEVSLVAQAAWLLFMSALFASMLPPTTGTVAYGIFGFFATYAAIVRLSRYREAMRPPTRGMQTFR